MNEDWGARLTEAGFTVEAERRFDTDLRPPLPAATRRSPSSAHGTGSKGASTPTTSRPSTRSRRACSTATTSRCGPPGWSGRPGAPAPRLEVDELDGHGRDVAHVEGFGVADGTLDGQHVAACAVREDRGLPRAAADRDPYPQ
jgi:hypothetical protein